MPIDCNDCASGALHITKVIQEFHSAASAGTNSNHWDDAFKSLVAPAVVAVFFTGITNYFLELLKGKREAISALSFGLRVELATLQDLTAEYWSADKSPSDAANAAKIMASLEAISTGLKAFQAGRKVLLDHDLDLWIVSLRDDITGGDFQTNKRKANFSRIQSSAARINRMRYKIFEERLKRM